jgi:hypothetical protein
VNEARAAVVAVQVAVAEAIIANATVPTVAEKYVAKAEAVMGQGPAGKEGPPGPPGPSGGAGDGNGVVDGGFF